MLKTVNQVIEDIKTGKNLLLAGEERLLAGLPAGNWIGGTIPYFMDDTGGKISKDSIYIQEVDSAATLTSIKTYSSEALSSIPAEAPENGFSIVLIPATSKAHISYAQNAPDYEGLFLKPLIGWITGVHLDDLGNQTPKAFNGKTASATEDSAVVAHFELPANKQASIGIVNVFTPGQGAKITFDTEGFLVKDCVIDGEKKNFADYIKNNNLDTQLPLVANYSGAMVNVSIQEVRDSEVALYAPVFKGVEYRFAAPVADYVKHFESALPPNVTPAFTCNCILNFLYSKLEGKKTEGMTGPITFGEIAYQLLNQTLVYLEIIDV